MLIEIGVHTEMRYNMFMVLSVCQNNTIVSNIAILSLKVVLRSQGLSTDDKQRPFNKRYFSHP